MSAIPYWQDPEPAAEEGACRVCGRDYFIGWGLDKDGGICQDYNCHTAARGAWIGQEPAPDKERAGAWARIFRESVARAKKQFQATQRNRRI